MAALTTHVTMKINLPITNQQITLTAKDQLVSTTDLKGSTTYANSDFQRISGFSSEELLGINHNLVRHPEMPPIAFADLWVRLKAGESWMGVVKNRCKNGDYYWVDAFISPVFEEGQHTGYQSVRVKPDKDLVKRASVTYAALNAGKQKAPRKRWSAYGLLLGLILLQILSTLTILYLIDDRSIAGFFVGFLGLIILGVTAVFLNPLKNIYKKALSIVDNPVAQQVYSGSMNEFGALDLALRTQQAQLRTVVGRVQDATKSLGSVASTTEHAIHQAEQSVADQEAHLNDLTSLVDQLDGSIKEIEHSMQGINNANEYMDKETHRGQTSVKASIESVKRMAKRLDSVTVSIESLREDAKAISDSVHAITEIADQTNLLALNAAIEAARAGDSGRGFAVVADSVRQLASNTQQVTETITTRIAVIQGNIDTSIKQMLESHQEGQVTVVQIEKAGLVLDEMTIAADNVLNSSQRVAIAVEEQAQANSSVIDSLQQLRGVANTTRIQAAATSRSTDQLTEQIKKMDSLAKAFSNKSL